MGQQKCTLCKEDAWSTLPRQILLRHRVSVAFTSPKPKGVHSKLGEFNCLSADGEGGGGEGRAGGKEGGRKGKEVMKEEGAIEEGKTTFSLTLH